MSVETSARNNIILKSDRNLHLEQNQYKPNSAIQIPNLPAVILMLLHPMTARTLRWEPGGISQIFPTPCCTNAENRSENRCVNLRSFQGNQPVSILPLTPFTAQGHGCNPSEVRGAAITYKLPAPGIWGLFNRIWVSDFLLIWLRLILVDFITDYLLPDRKYLCNETASLNGTLPPGR